MRKKVIMIECNNVQKQSKTKTLRQVLKDFVSVPDSVNKKISGIVLDSREVIDKSCFFALGGTLETETIISKTLYQKELSQLCLII